MPKLSIGIPVFNGQEFLPELLDSLLAQTYTHWEVIFWDNQSKDESAQIVSSRAATVPVGATKMIVAPCRRARSWELASTPMAGLGMNVTSVRSMARSDVPAGTLRRVLRAKPGAVVSTE